MTTPTPETPGIVLTDPKPLPRDSRCPRCLADRKKRVASSGFGQPHDVCGQCGYDFEEYTL